MTKDRLCRWRAEAQRSDARLAALDARAREALVLPPDHRVSMMELVSF